MNHSKTSTAMKWLENNQSLGGPATNYEQAISTSEDDSQTF